MARVLVTRAMPEAEETAAMLRAAGHEPVRLPLRFVEEIPASWSRFAPDALIATSRNAFRFELPEAWRGLPVFCVGARTAEAARNAGFPAVSNAEGDAAALARMILANVPKDWRLLYLAGEPRREELETRLGEAGSGLDVVPRYRMRRRDIARPEVEQALSGCDAVLHFSAESARAFRDLVARCGLDDLARSSRQICLSQAVATALQAGREPMPMVAVADAPEAEALLALIPA
jgi:uroporphyrinogen-III synthase